MILLRQFHNSTDADSLSSRLRGKGIYTFVSSKRSYRLSSIYTGAFKVGVWAVLDNQHQDAIELLKNKRHAVQNPLTEEEMRKLDQSFKDPSLNGLSFMLKSLVVLLLSTIIIVIAIYWFLYAK